MQRFRRGCFTLCWVFSSLVAPAIAAEGAEKPPRKVGFNRDVRPLLADKCYACHGPDKNKRKADLRLDVKESAFAERKGHAPIVPGSIEKSDLVRRITTDDAEDHMPPASSGKTLAPREIALLRRWIEEGAEWQAHWSYLKPARADLPAVASTGWVKSPLDRFILEKIEAAGLHPSKEADPLVLLRRLSFDLLGLPPAPAEVDAFEKDQRPDAYDRLVDRVLASPHYGERMALYWLDLVRYADTTGIHGDNHRNVAPYRDYVIRAFNENKRFDRFTIEQLAGDLLPEAGMEEKVASGYNRLLMTSNEGGAQPKEYYAKYAADRVRNASVVWMGATLGCAECHDHKFDPYTTRDFYRFGAFFADLHENVPAEPGPPFPVPSADQSRRLREIEVEIASVMKTLETSTPELEAAEREWEAATLARAAELPRLEPWRWIGPFPAESLERAHDTAFGPEKEVDLSGTYRDGKLRWTEEAAWEDGKPHALSGEISATYLFRKLEAREAEPLAISLGSDDGLRVWLNGKQVLDRKGPRAVAPDQDQVTVPLLKGENKLLLKVSNGGGASGFYFKALSSGPTPEKVLAILRKAADERSAAEKAEVAAHYRGVAPLLEPVRMTLAALKKKKEELDAAVPKTLVSMAAEPRTARVLPRGNWLDESGEVVTPAVPGFLKQLPAADRRQSRLDLARWLVDPENPLPARVFVNRLWKLLFGAGLARTPDDLGAQGAWPTHPELLDWLALEFVESGWDVKHMVKVMVLSAAYRQSSEASRELRERDPYNELLARQMPFRLDAEMVRDNALAASGLLVRTVGGPSVRPYQPPGYWSHLNFPVREYQADHGESLYRRGLYTYWCRTFLHPSLLAFDAPTREECTVNRPRSNTPLQALVLLNDPSYVEAARVFAERVLREGGPSFEDRLHWAYRRAVSRSPRPEEVKLLSELHQKHLKEYREDPAAAEKISGAGEWPKPSGLDVAEHAAWTSVARVVLNLYESVTRN